MKICLGRDCGEVLTPENTNYNGRRDESGARLLRARCHNCEIRKRLLAKRPKLKAIKNLATTNGGTARSRQKVRRAG